MVRLFVCVAALVCSLPAALCATPCNLNHVAYVNSVPLDDGMSNTDIHGALSCASGYTGAPILKNYFVSSVDASGNCVFSPPLDGCGVCGPYSQGGYMMHDGTNMPRELMQFSYLENEVVDTTKYKCIGPNELGQGVRGAYGGTVSAAFIPVCRKDPVTGKPFFQGKLSGCSPLCLKPDLPSALYPGSRIQTSTGLPPDESFVKGYSIDLTITTFECQTGWIPDMVLPTATYTYTAKCGFQKDFQWELFDSADNTIRQSSWCTHPNGTDSFVDRGYGYGYTKRGKASCSEYKPPVGYAWTSSPVWTTIEVPHTHVHTASEFVCDISTSGDVKGGVTCVDGEWEGRLFGCEPDATQCPGDGWKRLMPYGLYTPVTSPTDVTPDSMCPAPAVRTDNTKPVAGRIECIRGVWQLTEPFSGCMSPSCEPFSFSEKFPGYAVSWDAPNKVYNGDTLATAVIMNPMLSCHPSTYVGMVTTALADVQCLNGEWFVNTPSRAPEGCQFVAAVSRPYCHIADAPMLRTGYKFVVDPGTGIVTNLVCAEGFYVVGGGVPAFDPNYCPSAFGWQTMPIFSGCAPIECDGLKIACHGSCRDPPGKHCERMSKTAACCRDVSDEDVSLAILRPREGDGTAAGGFATAMAFSAEDKFVVSKPGSGAAADFVSGYQLSGRYASVSLDETAFGASAAPVPSAFPALNADQYKMVATDGEWVVLSTGDTAPGVPVQMYNFGAGTAVNVMHPGDPLDPVLGPIFMDYAFGFAVAISKGKLAMLGRHDTTTHTGAWGETRPLALAILEYDTMASKFVTTSYWVETGVSPYWPNGKAAKDHLTSFEFQYPYVVLGDQTFVADTGTAGYAQGQVYVWDVRDQTAGVLADPTPLIDWNSFSLLNYPDLKAGSAISLDFPYLAISIPGMPSCVRGVFDAGQGPQYRSHLYDLTPYSCPGSGAVFVLRYVERGNLQASWQNMESVILPPPNAGVWGSFDGSSKHTSEFKLGRSRGQLVISAKNGGALFVAANMASKPGLRHGSAVGPLSGAAMLRNTVLCYRKYRPNPLAAGPEALVSKWLQTATIGYDELRSDPMNDVTIPALDVTNSQDGSFGESLATYDGTQLIVGAPLLKYKLMGATDGVTYDTLEATVDATGAVTDPVAMGAGFYYHPLILPYRPCGPVPFSSFDGVIPPTSYGAGKRSYDVPCREGAPGGTSCDAYLGGFTCDTNRGYCGVPEGTLSCDNGQWTGTLTCRKCQCDAAPAITSEHSYQNDCSSVPWGEYCAVRCKPGLCGQPANGVFWCIKTEPDPRDPSRQRGAYHSTGTLGTCEPCTGTTHTIMAGEAPIGTVLQLGHLNAGAGNTWRTACDWRAGQCPGETSGTTWTVTPTPMWSAACTACPDCSPAGFDATPFVEKHGTEYVTPGASVPIFSTLQYECNRPGGFCSNTQTVWGGLAVCTPNAGFTGTEAVMYEHPNHCRKCLRCDYTRLATLYPNWIFGRTSDDMIPGSNEILDGDAMHPIACNPAYMGTYSTPVTTADDIQCDDGEWLPPSSPLAECPPQP